MNMKLKLVLVNVLYHRIIDPIYTSFKNKLLKF